MLLKVLLASSEGEAFFHLLHDLPGVQLIYSAPEEVESHAGDIDVFFGKPSAELLDVAPRLKWIQAPSAGVEFIANVPALVHSDVIVTNTRGAHGPPIGEHAMAMLLAMTRHIPASVLQQSRREWNRGDMYRTAREVSGMTMGIIGFGALGRGIAERAQAFGMDLIALATVGSVRAPLVEEVWPASRLDELIQASDVVTVTVPLTPETHLMLNRDRLRMMRQDSYLIAVSRGGIVDEDALVDLLREGRIAGAVLDVTAHEPLPAESPLWDAPNLLLTPHMAGASARKEQRVVEIFRENLIRYQQGDPLLNIVDKARGY